MSTLEEMTMHPRNCFNSLLTSAYKSAQIAKISIIKLEGIIKKFPICVASIESLDKKSLFLLCAKKKKKKKKNRQ